MLSVEQARERIVASVLALGDESVALAEAHGRVLAEAITAEEPVPAFANSGMDGYAVRAGDVALATPEHPVALRVSGDITAGMQPGAPVAGGTAVRIMTGAPLPAGADAIVPVEDTDEWPRQEGAP